MRNVVVVNNPKHWDFSIDNAEVVSAKEYLSEGHYSEASNVRVFNLCRSYRYQSTGYYVSLLAEARGHRVFPNVATIQDFVSQSIVRVISEEIDELIQKNFLRLKSGNFVLSIYFGQNIAKQYEHLSRQLYALFQAPFLRARFVYNDKKWILQNIGPIPLNEIPDSHRPYIVEFAREYFSKKKIHVKKSSTYLYDLAILVNPEEREPTSDKRAIKHFVEAGRDLGFDVEVITKDDYERLAEFDALFIRETTAVNHHTYRFSRRAYTEGMVVIDDPWSILRCSNKVYLTELLTREKIPIPKTLIVTRDTMEDVEKELGLPCVLKQPDSSFSQGVLKVTDRMALQQELENLLDNSDLIVAQEFIPTEFDWRIGILDRKPLFACKYYMAQGHWQIYNWQGRKSRYYGKVEAFAVETVPPQVVSAALKAANLVGDGFYGVDIKQKNGHIYLIEINDNPSVEYGVEDAVIKEKLYETVMRSFLTRLQNRNKKSSE